MILQPILMYSGKVTKIHSGQLLSGCICMTLLLCAPALHTEETGHKNYDCQAEIKAAADDIVTAANILAAHTYNFQHLDCAALTLNDIAESKPADLMAQLTALAVYADYMFYLHEDVLINFSYMVEEYHRIETDAVVALKSATSVFQALLKRAENIAADDPRVLFFKAVSAGEHPDAITLLLRVIKADPAGLHGAAYALLSEIYYKLPDLAGGDLTLAIRNFQKALQQDPSAPRSIRLLAHALEEDGQKDRSLSELHKLVELHPDINRLQATADELRNGIALADRLGDQDLMGKLTKQRENLLAEHPYLMKRVLTSLLMHSGEEHPLESER